MPTSSTSPFPAAPRHAAPPDRDRLGTLLTASWAALHVPVLVLLGLAVQHQHDARPEVAAAAAPDLPTP
ncbi:hypothetical protein [Streptomyces sp. NRRL S-350]|uniref:hypothetical protein n=1 Tax=Streptomyces sp. NRRL S-350 TaxID=1463902 RepID=UPI0004BF9CD3|nr:hypothetical protein [Streptomyces sp. NRRL S-350]